MPEELAHRSEEFLTRVCFFYILDKLSIENILNKRENYLKTERAFYNGYSTELEGGEYQTKSTDFRKVEKEKLEIELKMISDLRTKYCGNTSLSVIKSEDEN